MEHLETKADQIKIVRKQLQSYKQRPRTRTHPHMAATLPVSRGGEVEVTTTVKAKGTIYPSERATAQDSKFGVSEEDEVTSKYTAKR